MNPRPVFNTGLWFLALLAPLGAEDLINDSFDWGPGTPRAGIQAGDPIDGANAGMGPKKIWRTKDFHFGGVAGPGNGRALLKIREDARKDTGDKLCVEVDPGKQATATVQAKIRFDESGTGIRGIAAGWQVLSPDLGFLVNQSTDNIHVFLPANGNAVLKTLLNGQVTRQAFDTPVAFKQGEPCEITLSVGPGAITCRITTPGGSVSTAQMDWAGNLPALPIFAVNLTGCNRSPSAESAIESVRIVSGGSGP